MVGYVYIGMTSTEGCVLVPIWTPLLVLCECVFHDNHELEASNFKALTAKMGGPGKIHLLNSSKLIQYFVRRDIVCYYCLFTM